MKLRKPLEKLQHSRIRIINLSIMTCFCSSSDLQSFLLFLLFLSFLKLTQQQISVDIDSSVWQFPPNALCLSQQSNFADSLFSKNLNRLVSSIHSLTPNTYGFYNLSVGRDSDRVEAIGLCNRVLFRVDCRNCIAQAAGNLTKEVCPQHREAYVRTPKCMFRYSDKPILGKLETTPVLEAPNPNNATGDRNEFIRLQSELLNRLRQVAAAGGSKRKYAQGDGPGPPSYRRFFAATQCTPDLSEKDCNDCLLYGFRNATKGRVGIRWFCPSCNFQIESNLRFFRLESEYEADSTTEPPGENKTKIIIATVGSVVGFSVIIICLYILLIRNRRKDEQSHRGNDVEDNKIKDIQLWELDFDSIRMATNDFSPTNHLGEGGFGAVYKGVIENGEEIAVKRLSMKSGQGDNEFINEVTLVAKLQHRNLVRLLGFCLAGEERLLIYEFFTNTSLDRFIFDSDNRRTFLEWETRYKIISGVARGLLYLHEDSRFNIIHRDLKASNVLLDDAMNPKIADFGMARMFDTDQTTQTGFTSKIAGTYGYMAPEYAMNGQFSVKTDVFSFGILALEIITGKRNNWSPEEESSLFLSSYVWKCWREGTIINIVDPNLIETRGLSDEIMKSIHIALLCVQENAESRPTMASVIVMLNATSFTLPKPLQPAFHIVDEEPTARTVASLNNVSVTELDPR